MVSRAGGIGGLKGTLPGGAPYGSNVKVNTLPVKATPKNIKIASMGAGKSPAPFMNPKPGVAASKYSVKAKTDKDFAKELEKASQAVYNRPYKSLQERPGGGNPNKHYLRKKWIKDKKFIGLPHDIKQLSNTTAYKTNQKQLVLDGYNSYFSQYGKTPTVSQLRDYLNKQTGNTIDNRKFINKVINDSGLNLHKGKIDQGALNRYGIKYSQKGDKEFETGWKTLKETEAFKGGPTIAGVKNPAKIQKGHALRKTYYDLVPKSVAKDLSQPKFYTTPKRNTKHIKLEDDLIKALLSKRYIKRSQSTALKSGSGSKVLKNYQQKMKNVNNEIKKIDDQMKALKVETRMYDFVKNKVVTYGQGPGLSGKNIKYKGEDQPVSQMRDILASYLRDRIKDGGRVGFSTGGNDWGKQGETMEVKTTKTTQADKDSSKTFFSQSSAAKDVATGNKKILNTNETPTFYQTRFAYPDGRVFIHHINKITGEEAFEEEQLKGPQTWNVNPGNRLQFKNWTTWNNTRGKKIL